jgi:cell division protein FtsI/penicillin-binding protein 2
MASRPQFRYGETPSDTQAYNRAVTAGPPGSVFKAIIAAAALDQNLVRPDEQFDCHKQLDYTGKGQSGPSERMTFRVAMAKSCNDVFLQVGWHRLGVDGMRSAAMRFGFGAPTLALGREWADEQRGQVQADPPTYDVQMAFGQGDLKATPLQMARAYAAIANGGTLPAVHLVKAVKSPAGEVKARPAAGRAVRVMSEETAATVQDLLRGVTEPGGEGTGTAAWIPGVGSAGKTGTAEITVNHPDITDAWFAGYLPLRRPRYVVVVRVENGGYGGTTAAPIFREIGQAILAIKGY